MTGIDYHDRFFRSTANSSPGDAGSGAVFHYRQEGSVVWATYQGGAVAFGTLIAKVLHDGRLDMRYQQVTVSGAIKGGRCISTPTRLADGRIRLDEDWTWTEGGTGHGQSQIEESAR